MTFRRFILFCGLSLFCSLMAFAEQPTGLAGIGTSQYADQFLKKREFHFGLQRPPEEIAGAACYSEGTAEFIPGSLSFGTVTIGEHKTLTFRIHTISNGEGQAVLIDSIQTLNSKFQVTSAPKLPFCLANNQSVDVEVTFTPTSDLELVSQIKVRHTDSNSELQSTAVIVTGKGKEGSGGGGGLTVNPGSLDFGQVGVGQSSQKTFTIKNNGSAPQTVSDVKSSNAAFSISSPAFPKTLNGGQSLVVTVKFVPNKAAGFSGKLSVLTGAQVAALVNVSGSGAGNPDIAVSPNPLDYGPVDAGTFKDLNLTISNTGNGALEIQSFRFNDPEFEISPNAPVSIEGGKNRVFKVRFQTSTKGQQTKTLTIQSNDPDEKTVQVSMNANVIGGKIGFADRSISSRLRGNPIHTTALQWVDFNKDNKVDLYIVGTNGNVICNNAGQSKFTNGTDRAKLGNAGTLARGASWADVDNDGDLDVFIANENIPSVILKNNNGVFTKVQTVLGTSLAPEDTTRSEGGLWLDFNRDGKLDLYIVRNGAPNQLFKNNGVFNLVNVGASAKVDVNSTGRSAVVADFNNDGYPDIFVANFNRANKLFINNQNETFRDATASAGVGFAGSSVQAVVADYDQDGDPDLFVVNSGGSCILYRNQGNLKFQNATGSARLLGPKNSRSASFADYDNDGDDDLLVLQRPGGSTLFRNEGNGQFTRVGNVDLNDSDDPTSVVNGDFNNDGLLDVVIGDGDQGQQNGDSIFTNSGGDGNNFLILTLEGTKSNRSAIGAKVIVKVGLIPQLKEVSAGNGKNQESLPLEFGLGSSTSAATVQIFWPSGIQQQLTNVPAGRLKIVEPNQ